MERKIDFYFEKYQRLMDDTQWRYDNREKTDWFVEVDEMDPRGQCGPIYRPMKRHEFEERYLSDDNFKNMAKLKVKWDPVFEQDFDAMTNPQSPFYDENFVNEILVDYESIEEFTKSEAYSKMKEDYYK